MAKKNKKNRIPKNKDIEELVEQMETEGNLKERKEFVQNLKVEDSQIKRRVKNFSDRRDAQIAEEERKQDYLKAMNKLEELNDNNEIEIQGFFDDIQRKTDEYLKKQAQEER